MSIDAPSPAVMFRWEPAIHMFAELYQDGREIPSLPDSLKPKFNGKQKLEYDAAAVILPPGEYEFKIAKRADAACKASVWFRVTSESKRR